MTKQYDICLLPGDGIGPEIIAEGVKVLNAVGAKYDTRFDCKESLIGGAAIDAAGDPLPAATLEAAKAADAVLLAAVGGPKWDTTDPGAPRPEAGLLGIRKGLGLYTNLRPVQIFDALAGASTLKPEVIEGVDLMIVRELTGGLYFGKRERFYDEEGAGTDGAKGQRAYDTLEYREYEVERIARQAFEAARKRRGKVTSVDKANVLETSRMWREIVHRIGEQEYPDVQIEDLLVDNTAMQLINRPCRLRCGGHREHVRRHPLRRGRADHGLAWHAGLRKPGRLHGAVRAQPRQRPGYRRQGHCQPAGADPVRRDDAALQLRHERGGRRHPPRGHRGAR